jgi:hypothetical protein
VVCGGRPRNRERNAENRVGSKARLVRRAIKFAQLLVQCLLVVGVESMNGLLDLTVHVVSCIQYALAAVARLVAVAEFDCFSLYRSMRRKELSPSPLRRLTGLL